MNSIEPNQGDQEAILIDNLEISNLFYKWKPNSDLLKSLGS